MEEKVSVTEKREEKLKNWFSNPYNLALVLILLLAFTIHVRYLILTANQPLWWDEAVYMLKAKAIAFDTPDVGVNPGRSLLNSFIWGFLFKLGFHEFSFKILQIIYSLLMIYAVYYMGKELFNKEIGLFAAFVMSIFWVNIFAVSRFLPDPLGAVTWMLATIFFWEGYVKAQNPKYLWLVGPFFVIAFYTREISVLFLAVTGLYLLFTDKLKFLKNKHIWIAVGLALLMALPFFLYYYNLFGDPFKYITYRAAGMAPTAQEAAEEGAPYGTLLYFAMATDYLRWALIILLLIGLSVFVKLFLGFDLFLKQKDKELNKLWFLLLWALIPFMFFAFRYKIYNERYFFASYLAFFYIAGYGLFTIYNQCKKYEKIGKFFGVIVVIAFLIWIAYPHLQRADSLVKNKLDSYWHVKEAGLWIKQNSAPTDTVVGTSQPQLVYYSERYVYNFPPNETGLDELIAEKKPRYMMIYIFEHPPEYSFTYTQKHNDTVIPVLGLPIQQGSPQAALVVYELKY